MYLPHLRWPKSRSRKTLDALVEVALNTRRLANSQKGNSYDHDKEDEEEMDAELERALAENKALREELKAKNDFIQNLLFEMVMAKATKPEQIISPAMAAYLKRKDKANGETVKLPG